MPQQNSLNYDLDFLKRLPSEYYHLGTPIGQFSSEDQPGCAPLEAFFSLLLKEKKKFSKQLSINYDNFTPGDQHRKELESFSRDPKLKELYIEFIYSTTEIYSHCTMLHIKKIKGSNKKIVVFFKNPWGNESRGDFTESFPKFVEILNQVFEEVEIISDKTQQQSLSSFSCAFITYFNMVDHALGRAYRIPPVDKNGNNSPKVGKFRKLLAKDYAKYLKFYEAAKRSAEVQGGLKFPDLVKRRNDLNARCTKYQNIPETEINLLRPLFNFQMKHFLKEMDKFSFDLLISEKAALSQHSTLLESESISPIQPSSPSIQISPSIQPSLPTQSPTSSQSTFTPISMQTTSGPVGGSSHSVSPQSSRSAISTFFYITILLFFIAISTYFLSLIYTLLITAIAALGLIFFQFKEITSVNEIKTNQRIDNNQAISNTSDKNISFLNSFKNNLKQNKVLVPEMGLMSKEASLSYRK